MWKIADRTLQQRSLNCSLDFFYPDSAMILVAENNVLE